MTIVTTIDYRIPYGSSHGLWQSSQNKHNDGRIHTLYTAQTNGAYMMYVYPYAPVKVVKYFRMGGYFFAYMDEQGNYVLQWDYDDIIPILDIHRENHDPTPSLL